MGLFRRNPVSGLPPLIMEASWLGELVLSFLTMEALAKCAPHGQGQSVLLLPGFLANDISLYPMRRFLTSLGYNVHLSRCGFNREYSKKSFSEYLARLDEVFEASDGVPVILIGHSLGGTVARELARSRGPAVVKMVITLGSPFSAEMDGTPVKWLYDWVVREELPPELIEKARQPLPVPATSIVSITDFVVPTQCSQEPPSPQSETIPIVGAHCGLAWNPLVLRILARRLAQPYQDGQWEPLKNDRLLNGLMLKPAA